MAAPGTSAAALLVTAAGAITPFAFAPYGVYVLAVVGPGVLFHAWQDRSPRGAAWLGWLFGLGMFGHGVWWIQASVHQFGLPVYTFSVTVTVVFVMAMALYPAICGYLANRLPACGTATRPLVVYPLVWVLCEWLRGWLFTGFPWLLLGYSQTDSPLAGFVPLAGCHGASLVVALLAGLGARAWRAGARERTALAALALLVVGAGVVLSGRSWTRAAGAPFEAALVQGAVPQKLKWRRASRQATIDLYAALSAPHWGAALLVWPETALTVFPAEIPETLAVLAARAETTGTALLIGLPTGAPRGRYFNSVVALGTAPGRYDKRHLVPFGEYLPFDRVVRRVTSSLQIPMSDFSRGAPVQAPLRVAGYAAGVSICYEDAYSREIGRALPEAAFLVNVSNDDWFGDSIAPHQHLQIARTRALETGRYLVRATNTGVSAIIDEAGSIIARSPQFVPHVVRAAVVPRTGATPFTRYGDRPLLALTAAGLALAALAGRPARRP